MKRIIHLALLVIFNLSFINKASAQNPEGDVDYVRKNKDSEHKVVYCGNLGISLISAFINVGNSLNYANGGASTSLSSIPALQLSGDYYVIPALSLGGAISYQSFGIHYSNYNYINSMGNQVITNFTSTITRTNVAARVLFHYYNTHFVDMFLGVRVGFTFWGESDNSPDPTFKANSAVPEFGKGVFAPQLIYFGIRTTFYQNFGANMELSIGSPYFVSFGLNYAM